MGFFDLCFSGAKPPAAAPKGVAPSKAPVQKKQDSSSSEESDSEDEAPAKVLFH